MQHFVHFINLTNRYNERIMCNEKENAFSDKLS